MKRTSILGKRFYQVEEDNRMIVFPSVTTILSHTTDKTWLYQWRKRVGEETANKISRRSAGRGTIMHLMLEIYTQQTGDKTEKLQKMFEILHTYAGFKNVPKEQIDIGRRLFYSFYHAGFLDDIKETHLNEEYLYHIVKDFKTIPIGYSGTLDHSHWTYSNLYKVVDFKTSRKPKTNEQIINYKEQTAAYTIAVAKRKGITPDQAEIWIVNEQSDIPQRFIMNHKEIIKHYKNFTERVFKFYADNKNEIIAYYKNNLDK